MSPAGHLRGFVAVQSVVAVMAGPLSSPAPAEIVQKDGVRVTVKGEMSPSRLPRTGATPVAVSVSGRIVPIEAGRLPQLQRISIAVNRHGRLDLRGIPVCRSGHIDPSTTAEAVAACRRSLIGEGRFSARVKIPEQSPFPSEGKILAFNGRLGGRPAILAHVFGTRPVPTSYVLPFLVKEGHGAYGKVLEASLPGATGEWGYVTGISLDLDRGLFTAACPAPEGFPGTVFPLIRTTFAFDGGSVLASTVNRSCRVR